MKINFRKIVSLLLVCVFLVGSIAGINVSAEDSGAKLEIVSNNVNYGETLNLMYAVKATNLPENAEVTLTLYNADKTVFCNTVAGENAIIDGAECLTFTAKKGVAAQNISHSYLAKAEAKVDGAVVASTDYYEYSVLEYLYERLIVNANEKDDNGNSKVSEEQKAMYKDLIQYAKSAEIVLTETAAEDRIDQYVYVSVSENGTVDGVKTAGMFKVGTTLDNKTATLEVPEGFELVWDADRYNTDGTYINTTDAEDLVLEEGIGYVLTPKLQDAAAPTYVYKLVTDASQITVGSKIIIAAKDYDYAISTTQNGNNRGQAAITKNSDNNTADFGSDVQVITVEAGMLDGTFAFNVGSGYLYAASSSKNYMRTETTLSNNSSWKITIESSESGDATIVAQGANTRNTMYYNKSSSLFSTYSGAQQAIVVYVLTAE